MDAATNGSREGDPVLADPTPWELITQLVRTKTVLVVLLAAVLGVALILAGGTTDGTASVVLLSTGTSLAATVVYGILHSTIVAPEQLRQLQVAANRQTSGLGAAMDRLELRSLALAESVESSRVELETVRREIRDIDYKPFVYPETVEPDPRLNSEIRARLERTGDYTFVGLTGTFTVARLKALERQERLRTVRLVLADPSDPAAIQRRIGDEPGRPDSLSTTLAMISQTVVGAYENRSRYNKLTLVFIRPDQLLDRYEIFDDCIYLSLFGDALSNGYRFPRTFRYPKSSPFYVSYQHSTNHVCRSAKSINLNPQTTVTDLAQGMKMVGLDPNAISQSSQDFLRYYEEFFVPSLARGGERSAQKST